jgi:hypothetical protein
MSWLNWVHYSQFCVRFNFILSMPKAPSSFFLSHFRSELCISLLSSHAWGLQVLNLVVNLNFILFYINFMPFWPMLSKMFEWIVILIFCSKNIYFKPKSKTSLKIILLKPIIYLCFHILIKYKLKDLISCIMVKVFCQYCHTNFEFCLTLTILSFLYLVICLQNTMCIIKVFLFCR